jgi:hypothetical protein
VVLLIAKLLLGDNLLSDLGAYYRIRFIGLLGIYKIEPAPLRG